MHLKKIHIYIILYIIIYNYIYLYCSYIYIHVSLCIQNMSRSPSLSILHIVDESQEDCHIMLLCFALGAASQAK